MTAEGSGSGTGFHSSGSPLRASQSRSTGGLLEPIFAGGYFPSFNLADSAITLGAIGLILDEVLRVKRSR